MKHVRGRRVLFVSVTGWLGGPARSLATLLQHRDSKTSVLACPRGELVDLTSKYGSIDSWVSLWRHPRLRKISRGISAGTLSLWILLNRASLSVIHANGLAELNLVGLGAALSRTPVVVWSHASVSSPIAGPAARFWQRVLPSVTWVAVSDVARSVVCSSVAVPRSNVLVVPNPIDPADVVAESPSRDDEQVVISYLSEASHFKGFDVLVGAIEGLRNRSLRWILFTRLGDSSARRRSLVEHGTVELHGRVKDVSLAYARSDIVFCPSRRESFGRVAAEAMLNGIPVVASDLPAFRELLGNEEAGICFEVGSVESASAALLRLIDDAELRHMLGRSGRERAARFAPKAVSQDFNQIYAAACARAPICQSDLAGGS